MNKLFSIHIEDFSFLAIIWGLVLGFISMLIWMFIKRYLVFVLFKSKRKRERIERKLPLFESIYWGAYILYLFYLLVIPFPALGILIVFIFLLFSKEFLINYVHGLFYRFKDVFKIGQVIQIGSEEGTVYELNNLELVLENNKGVHIYFPYKKLHKSPIKFLSGLNHVVSEKITLYSTKNIDKKELITFLNKLPWGLKVEEHDITITTKQNGRKSYVCHIKALNLKFIAYIKKDLFEFMKN